MANIRRMADTGKLVVARPITDGGGLRGIFIFSGVAIEEARKMAEADPAIQTGSLKLEPHPRTAGKGLRGEAPKQSRFLAARADRQAGVPLSPVLRPGPSSQALLLLLGHKTALRGPLLVRPLRDHQPDHLPVRADRWFCRRPAGCRTASRSASGQSRWWSLTGQAGETPVQASVTPPGAAGEIRAAGGLRPALTTSAAGSSPSLAPASCRWPGPIPFGWR